MGSEAFGHREGASEDVLERPPQKKQTKINKEHREAANEASDRALCFYWINGFSHDRNGQFTVARYIAPCSSKDSRLLQEK